MHACRAANETVDATAMQPTEGAALTEPRGLPDQSATATADGDATATAPTNTSVTTVVAAAMATAKEVAYMAATTKADTAAATACHEGQTDPGVGTDTGTGERRRWLGHKQAWFARRAPTAGSAADPAAGPAADPGRPHAPSAQAECASAPAASATSATASHLREAMADVAAVDAADSSLSGGIAGPDVERTVDAKADAVLDEASDAAAGAAAAQSNQLVRAKLTVEQGSLELGSLELGSVELGSVGQGSLELGSVGQGSSTASALAVGAEKGRVQISRQLLTLARSAAWVSAMHALLAAAAAVWASEALFVLVLGIGQRIRLMGLNAITQGRRFRGYLPTAQKQAQNWVVSVPQTADDFKESFNYRLNLAGLQMEQAMAM